MLYDRWQRVAKDHAAKTALVEVASNRRWTFAELAAAAAAPPTADAPVWFARHSGADFILAVLQAWRGQRTLCPLEPDQPAPHLPAPPAGCVHLKITSATTGPPRVVCFTAAQLAADADHIIAAMGLRPDWPNLGVISLAHSYGFSSLVTPLLLHGIPLVLGDSPLPEAVRRAADAVPNVTLPGVPALWRAWHDAAAIPSNVRLAISAGAPLPLPLEQAIHHHHGLKVHNFYGATECGGIAYDDTATPRPDPTLAGRPLAGVTTDLSNEGCLIVHGPAVGTGYWPQASPELGSGRYVTADLAQINNGQVRLLGRAGDQIHVAGRKIAPELIEAALLQHPAVSACLILGLPLTNDTREECIAAVVVTTRTTEVAALRQHLQRSLPAWQIPQRWHFVPSLETTERGKLSRRAWRDRLLR